MNSPARWRSIHGTPSTSTIGVWRWRRSVRRKPRDWISSGRSRLCQTLPKLARISISCRAGDLHVHGDVLPVRQFNEFEFGVEWKDELLGRRRRDAGHE